jgi:O-antigen/teichoic acid export membrane protein
VLGGADGDAMTGMMTKVGRIQFFVSAYILSAFLLLGRRFIILWAGADYELAWVLALVVMIPNTLTMTRNAGDTILQAKERNAVRAVYYSLLIVVAVGIGLLLRMFINGAMAMAIGMMLASSIGNAFMGVTFVRILKVDMRRFYREVFFTHAPWVSGVVLGGAILLYMLPVVGWLGFALEGFVFTAVFWLVAWHRGLNAYEKGLFGEMYASGRARLGALLGARGE